MGSFWDRDYRLFYAFPSIYLINYLSIPVNIETAQPNLFINVSIYPGTKAASAGWLVLVMGSFWGLELLPLAGTSLLPVIFYPLMDVLSEIYQFIKSTYNYVDITSSADTQ